MSASQLQHPAEGKVRRKTTVKIRRNLPLGITPLNLTETLYSQLYFNNIQGFEYPIYPRHSLVSFVKNLRKEHEIIILATAKSFR